MELVTCFQFDEDNFFVGEVLCQKDENGLLLAANSTPVEPDQSLLSENFLKWTGEAWVAEKKPTTPEECVAIGDLPHEKQTPRIHELRQLFDAICEGSTSWRVEQDPETFAKRVVPIPPEEEEAAEADRELGEFDAQVASLKDRMSLAMLQGDEEEVAALQAEYKTLMGI